MFDAGVLVASAVLLAGLIPLAILISRDRLRRYRSRVLMALEAWMLKSAPTKALPSFEVARIKYELSPRHDADEGANERELAQIATRGSLISFAVPALIYSGITGLSFITALFLPSRPEFWAQANFILSGMHALKNDLTSADLAVYQWNSGAAITAGFLGAYLFTLQYLVGRVRSYELSPTSFLIASVSLIEGCFVVAVARHLMFSTNPNAAFIPLAFILGYFPTFGITWIVERLRVRNLKRTEPAAFERRFVQPTDMIDGVDMLIKFRLMEAGVHDVQNLATANPILLYVETPYNLLTILDWIAQAQLIIAFGGGVAADLHRLGVRSIFDIAAMKEHPATRMMVLQKVWPESVDPKEPTSATEELFQVMLEVISGDVHVRRLRTFWEVMIMLVEPPDDNRKKDGPTIIPGIEQNDNEKKDAAD
jgi:hypothetical protein